MGGRHNGLMNLVKEMSFSSLTRPMSLFKIVGSLKSATKRIFQKKKCIFILFEIQLKCLIFLNMNESLFLARKLLFWSINFGTKIVTISIIRHQKITIFTLKHSIMRHFLNFQTVCFFLWDKTWMRDFLDGADEFLLVA